MNVGVKASNDSNIKLSSLAVESEEHFTNDVSGGVVDMSGKQYTSNVQLFDASYGAYATYKLNKKYKVFKGTFVAGEDNVNYTGQGVTVDVKILGDGEVLYQKNGISRSNSGFSFNINVEGINELSISTKNTGSWDFGFIYLVNACLIGNSLSISNSTLKMNSGDYNYITYSVTNANGVDLNATATFKSDNTSVAKISSKGKVVAVSPGICKITVKAMGLSKICKVIVLPSAITNIKTLSKSKNSVQLQWKKQTGAAKYQIYMYDKDLEEYTKIKIVKGSLNTVVITNLKKGTVYKFKIRGLIEDGNKKYYGDFSKVYQVTTKK